MPEPEKNYRTLVITFFPMCVAVLSLLTSIYNGYLNSKFVDLIQNNVSRVEYMKTCKEIIDAYFQVKHRAGVVSAGGERGAATAPGGNPTPEQIEGAGAIARFGALGTYLANLRDEDTRYKYTQLTRLIEKAMADAPRSPARDIDKLFLQADQLFGNLNDDCVKSAKARQSW